MVESQKFKKNKDNFENIFVGKDNLLHSENPLLF